MSAWDKAQKALAGGVNSPVRAFKAVGGEPVFMKKGEGAYLIDRSGKRYVDFCQSWGALIFGHAWKPTVKAVSAQAKNGLSFGAATELETELAEEIKKTFRSIERLRFTSSGTEAVMSAIRLARGVTGRSRILKFDGGYHGHADSLLVKAGSGLATFGSPDSAGVPKELANLTTVLPYNDMEAFENFMQSASDIAAVIVEGVPGNMGVVPPKPGFLQSLRDATKKTGALLIFDEVMSGYRVCMGGAGEHFYKITPDITVLGKVIGGGMPIGAFGGRKEIMEQLSPLGRVYQAGTLSGNPLSMAAGLSVLKKLTPKFYREHTQNLANFLKDVENSLRRKGKPVCIQQAGLMFTVFFSNGPIENFSDVQASDRENFRQFFRHLLNKGVYFPPSAFEACFYSAAHSKKDLKKVLEAIESW